MNGLDVRHLVHTKVDEWWNYMLALKLGQEKKCDHLIWSLRYQASNCICVADWLGCTCAPMQ